MTELDNIREMICEIGHIESVGPDQELTDAGFTSMSVLELLTALEDKYDIVIADDVFMAARTPRDLYQIVDDLTK